MRLFHLCFLISAVPTLSAATSVSECHAVLANGKFNTEINITNNLDRRAAVEYFCSSGFAESGSEKAFSLAAVYEGISGSSSYNEDAHSKLSNELCSSADRSTYSSARSVLLRQYVDKNTVDAWRDCVKQQTNLICDIEARGEGQYRLSVELPDTIYDANISGVKLSLGGDITLGAGNISSAEELVEGSTLLQDIEVKDGKSGSALFSGVLQAGSKPTLSCGFDLPDETNMPTLPEPGYSELNRILGDPNFVGFSNRILSMKSPRKPICTVYANESLSIVSATVNPSVKQLSVSYRCTRPNFRYTCGGPWASVPNNDFTGIVSADVSVEDNVVSVGEIRPIASTDETNCAKEVVQAIKQLNGRVLP